MITLLRRAIYGPAQCAVLSCQISSLVHTYVSTTVVDPAGNPSGPPAFVFDIDGVLIRGKNVIPAAKEAMSKVCIGIHADTSSKFAASNVLHWYMIDAVVNDILSTCDIVIKP